MTPRGAIIYPAPPVKENSAIQAKKIFIFYLFFIIFFSAVPAFSDYYTDYDVKERPGYRRYIVGKIKTPEEMIGYPEEAPEEAEEDRKVVRPEKGIARWYSFLMRHLHPHALVSTMYDDNILDLQERDRIKSDVVERADSGIAFILGRPGRNRLVLDMGARVDYYWNYTALNMKYNPHLYGAADLELHKGRHTLKIGDKFMQQYSLKSAVYPGEFGMMESSINSSFLSWKFKYKRFEVMLDYARDVTAFEDPYMTKDLEAQNYTAELYYNPSFTPKTRFLIGCNYANYEYWRASNDDNDNRKYVIYGGVDGKFTKKILGRITVGWEDTKYTATSSNINKKDFEHLTYGVNLEYRFSKKTKFLLTAASRDRNEAMATDEGLDQGYDFSLACNHIFTRWLTIQLTADYTKDEYSSGKIDNTYGQSVVLSYSLNKWVKASLKYNRKNKESGIQSASYKTNEFICETTITF